jgi:hypothetical protein
LDFFERWFGFSVGHGDGSFEFVFLLVLFTIMFVVALRFLAALRMAMLQSQRRVNNWRVTCQHPSFRAGTRS